SPEHRARHPLGRVPALELADGTTMFESAAICLQLADLNPDAELIPAVGSSERALAYQWVLFSITELEGPLFRWLSEGDGDASSGAAERFAGAWGVMESALGDAEWLVGVRLTVADVLCASVLAGANSRGLLQIWPGLEAYVPRSEARPAYARAAGIWDRPRT